LSVLRDGRGQRLPVASLASGELRPSAPDDVAVFRVEFHGSADPSGLLAGDQCASGTAALAEARGRFEWEQTASLMALVVNLVRDPKKSKPAKSSDFNPYNRKSKPVIKVPLSFLKEVFVK